MMRTLAGAAVLALNLSGCGETRSVEYFKAHPEEAREIKMRCAANGMAARVWANPAPPPTASQGEASTQSGEKTNANTGRNFAPGRGKARVGERELRDGEYSGVVGQ